MAANSHCFCLGFLSEPREGFQLKNDESPGCSSQPQPSEHGCEAGPEPILGDLFRVRGFRVSGCGVEIGKDVQGVEAGLFAVSGISLHCKGCCNVRPHVKCWTFRLPLHSIPPVSEGTDPQVASRQFHHFGQRAPKPGTQKIPSNPQDNNKRTSRNSYICDLDPLKPKLPDPESQI